MNEPPLTIDFGELSISDVGKSAARKPRFANFIGPCAAVTLFVSSRRAMSIDDR